MDIKKVIKASGWTLDLLAQEMTACKGNGIGQKAGQKGISQAALSKLLKDPDKIPYGRLKEIASIICVPVSELTGENVIRCPKCGQVLTLKIG